MEHIKGCTHPFGKERVRNWRWRKRGWQELDGGGYGGGSYVWVGMVFCNKTNIYIHSLLPFPTVDISNL